MTYTVTITITRPAKETAFLPTDNSAQQTQLSRKAASGYIREERSHNANVLTISHVWESRAAFEAFEQANKVVLESSRTSRDKYFTDHGVTAATTWVDE